MDLRLAGKRVLITGASRGIGLAAAKAFLAEGARVTAVARTQTAELAATDADFLLADLSLPGGPVSMIERALALDPALDVLVNNAGGGSLPDEVLQDPIGGGDDVWELALALNLYAAVRSTRAALPALRTSGGAVINVSSDSAVQPHMVPLCYSTAKAALNAFSRGLAEQVAGSGVRVNVVTPGATRTSLLTGPESITASIARAAGVDQSAVIGGMPEQLGLLTGQLIDPAEVARVIVLMSSPTMPSVVGSNWAIHAGSIKSPA